MGKDLCKVAETPYKVGKALAKVEGGPVEDRGGCGEIGNALGRPERLWGSCGEGQGGSDEGRGCPGEGKRYHVEY